MRRVSKAFAAASLIAVLTVSNVYALPSKSATQPSSISQIIKIIRHVVGLDDLSWPKP